MLYCPTCQIDYQEGKKFCRNCGTALVPKQAARPERRLAAWTQGLAPDGRGDGSFELRKRPSLTQAEALGILERLPVPPADEDPGEYCWPTLGFEVGGSISRQDNGRYYIFGPGIDREGSLIEAQEFVKQVFATIAR